MISDHDVSIDYTNHRGERRMRKIRPHHIFFGETEYHPGQQWFVVAYDIEKGAARTFAMSGVHAWKRADE